VHSAHARMIRVTKWLSAMCNVGRVRGGVWEGGSAPSPAEKKSLFSIIRRSSIRHAALAMLTPTPSALAVSKSYFFSSRPFSGVRFYLSTGFALWRMVFEMCAQYITIFCFLSIVRAHGAYHRL